MNLTAFGQVNSIEINTNQNTVELTSFFNATNDTLLLKSEMMIGKVHIFNEDIHFNFEKYYYSKPARVPVEDFPKGRLLVLVNTNGKRIVLVLNIQNPIKAKPEKE